MNKEFYFSGCVTYRGRQIGIVWNGQNAEHVMNEYISMPSLHPYTHVRIQQLAKHVRNWEPKGGKRFEGFVTDSATGADVAIIADIHRTFVLLISAIKKKKPGI